MKHSNRARKKEKRIEEYSEIREQEQALDEEEEEEEEKKSKKWILYLLLLLLAIVILILLLKSCDVNFLTLKDGGGQWGNFEVGGKREYPEEEEVIDTEYITFSGYGRYEVSAERPNVELSNPENNTVDMVFTLSDQETGDIIARTGKIHPGEYVYIDVVEYYTQPGTYTAIVNVSTSDEDDNPMNGLNQEMEIIVN